MNEEHKSGLAEGAGAWDDATKEETAAVGGFYDRIVAYEWTRLDRYVLEFAAVRHYLERYLPPPPASVLDVGGGPGRYALLLAQRGYTVTLVDLSPSNVAWAKEQFAANHLMLRAETGDIRDLSRFAPEAFDVALVLGPLYHITRESDRHQALDEVRRVLHRQGRLFSMMLTHAAAIYEGFNRWPEGILEREGVQRLMATGSSFNFERHPHDFEGVFYTHPSQVAPLYEQHHIQKLALAGCEGVLGGRREAIEKLSPELQTAWVDLMLQICEDPSILGAAERLLFVGEAI